MMAVGTKPKPKRRNSEKRKEKSRDAARTRRSKETEIFYQLAHALPVNYNLLSQLDKASIIRLIITHLKLRGIFQNVIVDITPTTFTSLDLERKLDQLYYKAIDGFLMVITNTGDLIYISDNVVTHLGVTQIDMLGQSIFDFVHPCDHEEIRDVCCSKQHFVDGANKERDFFVRMKSTLTSKGRSINLKSASYRVVHCSGHLMSSDRSSEPLDLTKNEPVDMSSFFVLNGRPIPHPSNVEIPLDSRTFVSRHSMDMKFVYCDEGISDMLGFKSDELIGKCLYEYHHALDGDLMEKAYKTLFAKGQSVTGMYRFLARNGGYAWVQTQATVVKNPRTEKAQFVICINSVVSEIQQPDDVLCVIQQPDATVNLSMKQEEEIDEKEEEIVVEEDSLLVNEDTGDLEEEEEEELEFVTEKFIPEKFLQNIGSKSSNCVVFARDAAPCAGPSSGFQDSSSRHQTLGIQPTKIHQDRQKAANNTMTPVSSSESLFKILGDFSGEVQEEDYEMRAPYISMDDMCFGPQTPANFQENSPLVSCSIDSESQMLVVSGQLNPEVITTFYTIQEVPNNDQENGVVKTKRPIEVIGLPARSMLGLAGMPPAPKVPRYQPEQQIVTSTVQDGTFLLANNSVVRFQPAKPAKPVCEDPLGSNGSSVLRNLLLNGEDVNFGYRLNGGSSAEQPSSSNQKTSGSRPVQFASTLYKLLCTNSDAVAPADNLLRMQNETLYCLAQQ